MLDLRRRQFLALLSGAAGWPLAARAQQPAMPVIGFLRNTSPDDAAARFVGAFRKGMGEAGYVEGHNVLVEYHWTGGQTDRLPAMAADLVARQVSVIVALGSTAAIRAAKAATTTIPIVFMLGTDPVELGIVASLNRPGGNLTGVVNLNHQLAQKWLEFLHQLVPATTFALLVDPTNTAARNLYTREMQAAARTLGLQIHVIQANSDRDFDAVFASMRELRVAGLVIVAALPFISHIEQLAALTLRHAVPAIFPFREFPAAGGLMSYGTDLSDTYRLAGVYTGRILKGEKPADLPVVQSTKVELIINLKTARALGVTVPLPLIGRADEVIE